MKPTLSVTINRQGARIHRIIDDITYPTRTRKPEIRRDPMVAALFGAASVPKETGDANYHPKPRG